MSITHFKAESIKKTNWSGGTTSELFIHPKGASFKTGEYSLRLSIATVEIEESTFTSLPDVDRTLMVLEGKLKLSHEGHHEAELSPLEFDNFKGDWNTKSWGKVTDFNLMTKGDCKGTLQGIKLAQGEATELNLSSDFTFIHTFLGSTKINDVHCHKSESALLKEEKNVIIQAIEDCTIVVVSFD